MVDARHGHGRQKLPRQRRIPPHLLIFAWLPDWDANAKASRVRVELQQEGSVTRVRLTHSGLTHFGLTHFGLTRDGARAHRGWPVILEWLQPCVEDEC